MPVDVIETDRSRDFSALVQCDAGPLWLPEALSQVQDWLREKTFDVDLSVTGDHIQGGARLMVRRLRDNDVDDLRIRLIEPSQLGTWTTELFAHDEASGNDWISLIVSNDQGRFVKVPRLARYLMQVLPLRDGPMEFTDGPQVFGVGDLPRLINILTDVDRHGLVFVAGTKAEPTLPFDAFKRKVGEWAKEVYGLAQVVVLDPAATGAFAQQVGARLEAPPWTIRTYQPGVDPEDGLDSRRHRILGTRRLADQSDDSLKRLLGDVARQQAATRPIDKAVERVHRRFERLENRRLVETLSSTEVSERHADAKKPPAPAAQPPKEPLPTVVDQTEELAALETFAIHNQLADRLVARFRHINADGEAAGALESRVDELQTRVEQLEDDNLKLLATLEDEQLATEVSRLDAEDRDAKIRWLESRLKEKGDYEVTYLDVPDEFKPQRPSTFDELLDRIDDIEEVRFTGDASEVIRLSQIDTNDAALRTAWDAVLAMADYVKARKSGECESGLAQYLKYPPSGYRSVPPSKFAATETATTMKSFGEERVFPVPSDVRPSGKAEMKAHFKLARIGMASPRMYVLDAHPAFEQLFIGYIGPHLTNTKTC